MRNPRFIWIEGYSCGCSNEVDRKDKLLKYCAIHGSRCTRTYKLPFRIAQMMKRQLGTKTLTMRPVDENGQYIDIKDEFYDSVPTGKEVTH